MRIALFSSKPFQQPFYADTNTEGHRLDHLDKQLTAQSAVFAHGHIDEYAVALALTLARYVHRAYNRVREGDVALGGCSAATVVARRQASSASAGSGPSPHGSWVPGSE